MGRVVTMQGNDLQTPGTLADWLKERYEAGEVANVVISIEKPDGFTELAYSRMNHQQFVFHSTIINGVAMEFAMSALLPDEE